MYCSLCKLYDFSNIWHTKWSFPSSLSSIPKLFNNSKNFLLEIYPELAIVDKADSKFVWYLSNIDLHSCSTYYCFFSSKIS